MGERIKELRRALDLTQEEFGVRLGVTRGAIVNLELNRASVKPLFIQHICDVFKVNQEWLETGEGEMMAPMSKDEEFLQLITEIQVSDDDFIQRMLRAYWNLDDRDKLVIRQLINSLADK